MRTLLVIVFSIFLTFTASAQGTTTQSDNQSSTTAPYNSDQQMKTLPADAVQAPQEPNSGILGGFFSLKAFFERKIEEFKSNFVEKKDDVKVRFVKIKDERKKIATEKIEKQLNVLNAKELKQYSVVLTQLDAALAKISKDTDATEAVGLDVTHVRGAIEYAKSDIEKAHSMIFAQSARTYLISVENEDTLKRDVGNARQSLRNDLKSVEETVKAAQTSIQDTAYLLDRLPEMSGLGEDTATTTIETNGTSTPENTDTTTSQNKGTTSDFPKRSE